MVGESATFYKCDWNGSFGSGQVSVFVLMDRISDALANGEYDKISDELDNIDSRMEKILSTRAEVGAKTNRIELMQGRLGDLEVN